MGNNFRLCTDGLATAINDAATKAMAQEKRKAQSVFDRLAQNYGGKPVDEVEPHVRSAFRQLGWKPDSEAELRAYAEQIADGTRIVFRSSRTRLTV